MMSAKLLILNFFFKDLDTPKFEKFIYFGKLVISKDNIENITKSLSFKSFDLIDSSLEANFKAYLSSLFSGIKLPKKELTTSLIPWKDFLDPIFVFQRAGSFSI